MHTMYVTLCVFRALTLAPPMNLCSQVGVMLVSMMLTMRFSKQFYRLRKHIAAYTDSRVKTISEVALSSNFAGAIDELPCSVPYRVWVPMAVGLAATNRTCLQMTSVHDIAPVLVKQTITHIIFCSLPTRLCCCLAVVHWRASR